MAVSHEGRRRVLVVVSAWRPAIIADMQRARMLAWELPKHGWDVEVLTPRASEVRQDIIEPEPADFFAADTPVYEVGSMARGALEAMGSRSHAWRTLLTMRWRGSELLRSGRFDLVYFTTTTFVYFSLGPKWKQQHAIPYVLDFHDPWIKERNAPRRKRRWQSRWAEWLAARMERRAVISATGLIAVSPSYIEVLGRRYATSNPPWSAPGRNEVIPFGAREADLTVAAKSARRSGERGREIVVCSVGAGGEIMLRSFELICRAIAAAREQGSQLADRVRIGLFGTTYDWKSGDQKLLEATAQRLGAGGAVSERPKRITYRCSLELLLDCDGALILGVDDAGYMPSKLFNYALSGKPLLASLHRQSPAFAAFETNPKMGHVLWFDHQGDMPIGDAVGVVDRFLHEAAARMNFDRHGMLERYLAPNMASRHARLFDACVE